MECPKCDGSGQVEKEMPPAVRIAWIQSNGYVPTVRCDACDGEGRLRVATKPCPTCGREG